MSNVTEMLENIKVLFHSSIRIQVGKRVIYFDPYQIQTEAQDADIIFITHDHFDHFSPEDIRKIQKKDTILVLPQKISKKVLQEAGLQTERCIWMRPGQMRQIDGVDVETFAAYNVGKPFHQKQDGWLGYLLVVEEVRIFVAGDTDQNIENEQVITDIALVPIGGMFTMDASGAAEYVNMIRPQVAIPIHYGSMAGRKTDEDIFRASVEDSIQVAVKMQRY